MSFKTKRQINNLECQSEKKKKIKLIKKDIWNKLIDIETNHWKKLLSIDYGVNVNCIYNPLDYAKEPHENYVKTYCTGNKEVLLLGMNPGPWGMCQTGVPFGEVNHVKNWLNIEGTVRKPEKEHQQRLIEGFNCKRSEVSGNRMWELLQELCGEPKVLFRHVFLHNYCPLAFLEKTGKNIPLPNLKARERKELEEICDSALLEAIELLNTKHLICIGNYVLEKSQKALAKANISNVQVSVLMHPSPVNPKANKGWKDIAIKQLEEAQVLSYFKGS